MKKHKKQKKRTNNKKKFRKTYLFKIILKQIFKENFKFNIFLVVILFIPKILSQFNLFNLNIDVYNIYIGSLLSIITAININEGYTLYRKEYVWNNYRNLILKMNLKILISINHLLSIRFYSLYDENLKIFDKINKEIDGYLYSIIDCTEKDYEKEINILKEKYKEYFKLFNSYNFLGKVWNRTIKKIELKQAYDEINNLKKLFIDFNKVVSRHDCAVSELVQLSKIFIALTDFETVYAIEIKKNDLSKSNNQALFRSYIVIFDEILKLKIH